jgi:hypothetical protein
MIFREILSEDRVTFLKDKYLALIWAKYQEKERHKILDSDQQVFEALQNADPTGKKNYFQWLVLTYLNDNTFLIEDISRVYDALVIFERAKSKIPVKDINQYKTLKSLYDAVEPFENQEIISNNEAERRKRQAFFDSGQAELYYKSKNFTVIIPKTIEASQYFGQGTKWCTAGKNNNMFNAYTKKGPLYILLPMKWQFQFESNSYMDERDVPISNLGEYAEEIGKVFSYQFTQEIKKKKTVRYIGTESPGFLNISIQNHNAIMRGLKELGSRANEINLLRSNKSTTTAMIVITKIGKLLLDDRENAKNSVNDVIKQAIGIEKVNSELDALVNKILPKILKEFKAIIPKLKENSLLNWSIKTNFSTNQNIREMLKNEKIYQEVETLQNQRIQKTLDEIEKFDTMLMEIGFLEIRPNLEEFKSQITDQTLFKDPSHPNFDRFRRRDNFDYD